jgi:hypothetical protein
VENGVGFGLGHGAMGLAARIAAGKRPAGSLSAKLVNKVQKLVI